MEIDYTPEFKRTVKKLSRHYRSIRQDIEPLIRQLKLGARLSHSPYAVFKVRLKNSDNNKGKSGGYRVIYYLKYTDKIVLVTIYSKSDQGNMDDRELHRIIVRHDQ